jgi:hypothetical protein
MLFSTHEETFLTEITDILPVSSATSREKLWPFIEQAERKYIKPLLEDALYASIHRFYNDNGSGESSSGDDSSQMTALLKLIQIAEINLAYFIGFDLLNVITSDSGFQKPGDGGNFKGLYKYQEENLRRYFEQTGYNGLDDLLKYIEDNIESFPEWEDSSLFAFRKTAIIKDSESFDAICFINRSRLTFCRLQRYMNEVLDFDVKPLLGAEWALLMAQLQSGSPDAKYTALGIEIRKPLAYLSCALLIEKTGNLNDRGLFFEGKNSGFPDDSYKNPAQGTTMFAAAASYRDTGKKYLAALSQYLIDNEFTSTGSASGSVFNRDNEGKKIFVA